MCQITKTFLILYLPNHLTNDSCSPCMHYVDSNKLAFDQLMSWKELAKNEEARKEELRKEKERIEQYLNVKMEVSLNEL